MVLTEQSPVPAAALPVAAFRDHLRLGTGFADDAVQDSRLEALLRAALSAVEARTGKALLARAFAWRVSAWRDLAREVLPVAPVSALTGFSVREADGTSREIEAGRYRLVPDAHRPAVAAAGLCLPSIPVGGAAEIRFEAGFGPDWASVPPDLAQAVFLLGAHYHARREAAEPDARPLPEGVAALVAPHRVLRLFGGAG